MSLEPRRGGEYQKGWAIIRMTDGALPTMRVWRDYGQAWGSPSYVVVEYFEGTYRDARRHANWLYTRKEE